MLNYYELMKLVAAHPRQIMYYNEKSCGEFFCDENCIGLFINYDDHLLSLCKYCLDGRFPDIIELSTQQYFTLKINGIIN